MKHLCIIILVFTSMNFTCPTYSAEPLDREGNVRGEIKGRLILLHKYQDKIDPQTYDKLLLDYTDIQHGINDTYKIIASKIAGGYLLVGRNKVKKEKFAEQIEFYEKKSLQLKDNIEIAVFGERTLSSGSPKKIISLFDEIIGYLTLLELEKKIKTLSCQKAEQFYIEKRWSSFDEITDPKFKYSVKMRDIIGDRCIELLNKDTDKE